MKEQLKKYWKKHKRLFIGLSVLLLIATGALIYNSLNIGKEAVKVVDSAIEDSNIVEETQKSEEVTETVSKEPAIVSDNVKKEESDVLTQTVSDEGNTPTEKAETEKKETADSKEEDSSEKQTTKNQISEPTAEPTAKPTVEPTAEPTTIPSTVTPVKENKYVPITEGWKASKSAQGDITSSQKSEMDTMIESWKNGTVSDKELKENIVNYLNEQGIDYMEVSVTSKGYALYDTIPEIDLRDGGNLYSFVGTYSTGEQNPDGTNKTVCYNWSAFVF